MSGLFVPTSSTGNTDPAVSVGVPLTTESDNRSNAWTGQERANAWKVAGEANPQRNKFNLFKKGGTPQQTIPGEGFGLDACILPAKSLCSLRPQPFTSKGTMFLYSFGRAFC